MDDEDGLECPVCLDHYNETTHVPKMLPCLHTTCASCLLGLTPPAGRRQQEGAGGAGGGGEVVIPRGAKIRCPMCRSDVTTDQIQTNRYILDHLRHLTRMEERMKGERQKEEGDRETRDQAEARNEEIEEKKRREMLRVETVIRKETDKKEEMNIEQIGRPRGDMWRDLFQRETATIVNDESQSIQQRVEERGDFEVTGQIERQDRQFIGRFHFPPNPPDYPPFYPYLPPSPLPHFYSSPLCSFASTIHYLPEKWCRTCEQPAQYTCQPLNHTTILQSERETPLSPSQGVVAQQHRREEELKRRHKQAEEDRKMALLKQIEEDRKMALGLAGLAINTDDTI